MVFERFSDQARQVVTPRRRSRPHPPPELASAPNTCPPQILGRRRPRSGSADSHGASPPRHSRASSTVPAPRRAPPRPRGTSQSPAKTKKVLEASLRQTALLGHEEIGTEHLLLALLDDPASTGAQILTDLASLPISEMREHLRRELAQQPTPGPAHRIPIRLSDDEYTRAHAAARTAGQNLETSGPRPHHRRRRTTRIAGSVGGEEQLHRHEEPHHQQHERAHQRAGRSPCSDRPRRWGP
ncbi:Clp protease N-terminal domain-containing protein [Rhodococcus jostii]|uniref:ATP-dependent Clp protease ATP-binding subunit ClpC n=2 Tax=Rhodococcus jostii TaxID=132919 RepID=A0A1H4IZ49_RHOJO|nr:Clp protease N-terminal domain-containing protein [Rhodococcus jostii]SEB38936.1 ATP-dependent Clp protease ATP-binding subunit ClpC [Rhodococcus jostii]